MRNNTCIICNTEFEPREGKLYCSNACKQKGYTDNKQQTIGKKQKEQEEIKTKKQFVIYFSEYQKYRKAHPNSLEEFPLFCFFRKNWTGTFNIEQFRIYIQSLDSAWWDDFWDMDGSGRVSPARKKYNEFQERFFGGDEFIVSFEENN